MVTLMRITSKWRHFAAEPELQAYKGLPYLLEASGDEPVIYLNQDFPDLPMLLAEGRRRAPDAAALNEMTLVTIAQGCLMALFNIAAAAIAEPEQGQDYELPSGWKGQLLADIIEKRHPDKPEGDALGEIYDDYRQNPALLQSDVLLLTG